MTAQVQQPDPFTMNLIARSNLLKSGIKMVKQLAPVTATGAQCAAGTTLQIPLLRMGIMTGITLLVTAVIDSGAAHPTPSQFFPHNLVSGIQYTDFAGVNRTKTSPHQLWAAQSAKSNELGNSTPYHSAGEAWGYRNSNVLTTPDDASAWANATPGNVVSFSLYIPLAYDPANDLTGAVLTQTNVGEHNVYLTVLNSLVGADSWINAFTAGNATWNAAGIKVEAFQHYIQPQSMTADQIPVIDLSTVYGFEGGFNTSANIGAGQPSYVNYPNNRSILSAHVVFENGGAGVANETDVTRVTLLANSNTNFWEMTPRLMRQLMRHLIGGDLPSGSYYFAHRRQPIMTQLYANVQAKFDVATVNAGVVQFISQYEVQYPSGSPLPGITG
jgi:hypothetical protein